jgi:hypothetical protein
MFLKYYMRTGIYYLPENHNFKHIAIAPWPHIHSNWQLDWVDAIDTLESWLNLRIGPHYSAWAYSQQHDLEYWQACIAFKEAKYKTLFLLTWTT